MFLIVESNNKPVYFSNRVSKNAGTDSFRVLDTSDFSVDTINASELLESVKLIGINKFKNFVETPICFKCNVPENIKITGYGWRYITRSDYFWCRGGHIVRVYCRNWGIYLSIGEDKYELACSIGNKFDCTLVVDYVEMIHTYFALHLSDSSTDGNFTVVVLLSGSLKPLGIFVNQAHKVYSLEAVICEQECAVFAARESIMHNGWWSNLLMGGAVKCL